MDTSSISLTAALEAALRSAALYELECGADDLRVTLTRLAPGESVSQPNAIDWARARVAHAGLLLDELGYVANDRPIVSLTVPTAALRQVAGRALDELEDQIREPGCIGHVHSPDGLRASANLWDELARLIGGVQVQVAP